MKLCDLPNDELVRAIVATAASATPDQYALQVLVTEFKRRLELTDCPKEDGPWT